MPNYKSPDNAVHFLDSSDFEYLLPVGSVQITDEEAEALHPIPIIQPVIYTCSPWQIRKALNDVGLRQQVEDAVAASGDIMIKDGWEFATEFRSDDQFVLAMGGLINLDASSIAAFIEQASHL